MTGTRLPSPSGTSHQVLAVLRDAPGGLTIADLTAKTGKRAASAVQALARRGAITRAGAVAQARPQNKSSLWVLSPAGAELLERIEARREVPLVISTSPAGRPAAIMAALEGHPEGLTASQVAELIGMPVSQKSQSWISNILSRMRRGGCAEIMRKTPGDWQQAPQNVWGITDAGRRWLASVQELPQLQRQAQARAAAAHQDAVAARLRAAEMLVAVEEKHGPGTPHQVRRIVAADLRDAGCTLRQISSVFGVTAEQIRLDTLPEGERRQYHGRRAPKYCPHCHKPL